MCKKSDEKEIMEETLEEEKAELEGVNQDLRDSLADLRRKANDEIGRAHV